MTGLKVFFVDPVQKREEQLDEDPGSINQKNEQKIGFPFFVFQFLPFQNKC